jgi:hypothetical protein
VNHSSSMLLFRDLDEYLAIARQCPREFTAKEWSQVTGKDSRRIRKGIEAGLIVLARRGDWRPTRKIPPLWRLSDETLTRLSREDQEVPA